MKIAAWIACVVLLLLAFMDFTMWGWSVFQSREYYFGGGEWGGPPAYGAFFSSVVYLGIGVTRDVVLAVVCGILGARWED